MVQANTPPLHPALPFPPPQAFILILFIYLFIVNENGDKMNEAWFGKRTRAPWRNPSSELRPARSTWKMEGRSQMRYCPLIPS
jgi:hypothetical protein